MDNLSQQILKMAGWVSPYNSLAKGIPRSDNLSSKERHKKRKTNKNKRKQKFR